MSPFSTTIKPLLSRSSTSTHYPSLAQMLQSFIFALLYHSNIWHSSQFFVVSALLRESFARFLLHSLVITLSCSLSPIYLSLHHLIRLYLCHFRAFHFFSSFLLSSMCAFLYLFSKPSNHRLFVSLTFYIYSNTCFPILVYLPSYSFAHTIHGLNDASFHPTSTAPSFCTPFALPLCLFVLPTLPTTVFPSSGTPTLRPFVLLLVCYFFHYFHLLLRISLPQSFEWLSATSLCLFLQLLLSPFCSLFPLLRLSILLSPVSSFIRLYMSPSLHVFVSPFFCFFIPLSFPFLHFLFSSVSFYGNLFPNEKKFNSILLLH